MLGRRRSASVSWGNCDLALRCADCYLLTVGTWKGSGLRGDCVAQFRRRLHTPALVEQHGLDVARIGGRLRVSVADAATLRRYNAARVQLASSRYRVFEMKFLHLPRTLNAKFCSSHTIRICRRVCSELSQELLVQIGQRLNQTLPNPQSASCHCQTVAHKVQWSSRAKSKLGNVKHLFLISSLPQTRQELLVEVLSSEFRAP